MTDSAKHVALQFEKEFLPELTVWQSMPAVLKSKNPKISEYAVQALDITDYPLELTSALAAEHEEARVAAIEALRRWLPRQPENAQRLRQELGRLFPEESVETILRLLWGYSPLDAQDPMISVQLVTYLDHDEIAIRELAGRILEGLTGRTYEYRASLRGPQRQASINRWTEHVQSRGSLLPLEN